MVETTASGLLFSYFFLITMAAEITDMDATMVVEMVAIPSGL